MKDWVLVTGAKLKKMTMKQVAAFTLNKMNSAYVISLVKYIGKERAMEDIFNRACEMGHEFMLELYSSMPKDIERISGIGQAAWIIFAGKKPSETIFEPIEIGGYKGYQLLLRDNECTFCEGISFDGSFCTFPVGAYQGASQTWVELTGHKLKTFTRETKCKAKGDPYCELTQLFVDIDMPLEVLQKEKPELFEELNVGFTSFE